MKQFISKEQLIKILIPVLSVGVLFGIWSFIAIEGKLINSQWLSAILFLVILVAGFIVDPYSQFCSETNYNSFGNSNPFGIDGWITSLIHWLLLLLIYVYITRKLPLRKSLFCFLMLALISLAAVYLIFLGVLKFELCISGC